MTCESLFQIVSASLSLEDITRLFRKHRLALPEASRGKVALYQEAHEQCHRPTLLARRLQRYLDRKHAAVIRRLTLASPEQVRGLVHTALNEGCLKTPVDDIAGLIWAVASDPRPDFRAIEQTLVGELHLLSHCLLVAQFRGQLHVPAATSEVPAVDPQLLALQQETIRLHMTCQEQQAALQRLGQHEAQLLVERDRLQQRLKELTHHCATLQQQKTTFATQAAPEGATLRELRKLRYEVEKLHACIAAQDSELQRQHAMLAAYEAQHSLCTTVIPPAAPPSSPSLPLQALHGKTVALIGAMDKMASHYEHVIQELGGGCLRHDGDMRQGQKGLVDVIKRADIILCPVDCNSHGAVACTKKVCRTLQKTCYFLRSSGVSHLRAKLMEVAVEA
jgi:hypothetical protein